MAYRAYLNGVRFFDTSSMRDDLKLSSASIQFTAGAAGEFTFSVPPNNILIEYFHPDRSRYLRDYIDVYKDNSIIFCGRISSSSINFDLSVDLVAEGLLAVLNDSISAPIKTEEGSTATSTMTEMITYFIGEHNSQVDQSRQITIEYISTGESAILLPSMLDDFSSYDQVMGRLESLVNNVGGYMLLRKDPTDGTLYFSWLSNDDLPTSSQRIELGSNLIELTYSRSTEELVTCLIVEGKSTEDKASVSDENLSIDGSSETVIIDITDQDTIDFFNSCKDFAYGYLPNGKLYVYVPSAVDIYGTVVRQHTFETAKSSVELAQFSKTYLDTMSSLVDHAEIRSVDLVNAGYTDLEEFQVANKIMVYSPPHSLMNYAIVCTDKNVNLLDPSSDDLTFDTYKKHLSSAIFG